MGALLLDFFGLYGGLLNYVHAGISLIDGGKYFSKRERGADWHNPNRPSILSFENPTLPDVDFGKSSFMMPKIRRSFEHAHQLLSAALSDSRIESYLSYVIRTDDALLIDREMPELGARKYNQFEALDQEDATVKPKKSSQKQQSSDAQQSKKRKASAAVDGAPRKR